MKARAWIALVVLASSCAREPTEIVLVVDTDIAGVESFYVEATGPDMEARIASADLSDQRPPRTLVLVRRGGELGPIHVRVEARAAGEPLASVRRIVRFAPGRSLPLFVFLADGCRSASCEPRGTCGNAGECRSARVRACEHEGTCDAAVDAGVRAASPGASDGGDDGGACALGGMCGVEARHLPGDRVAPSLCAPIEPPTRASITGPGGELTASGDPASFALGTPGTYVARVELAGDSTCAVTRELEVVAPAILPDSSGVSADELRDLAARVGAAFVAGRRGLYAIDAGGWVALRAVATGDPLPEDLRGLAVFAGHPIVGTHGDRDSVHRVIADAPFDSASVRSTLLVLPPGSREVRAIDVRLDGRGPVLVATKDGAVTLDEPDGATIARAIGPPYDPTAGGFAAIGADESTRGAIWLGRSDEVVNRSVRGGVTFNEESGASLPTFLGIAREAEVDDRDPAQPRLWICGSGGVAVWSLTADFGGRSTLPAPSRAWAGSCRDLAVGDDGEVWIAAGLDGLVRVDATALLVVRYDDAAGLPPGTSVDRVAFAADAARREVWMLDASSSTRALLVLSADARP